jgi:competence protein ComEC
MAKKITKSQAKKAAKTAKKHPKIVIAIAVIVLIIVIAAVVLYIVKPDLYHKYLGIGDHNFDNNGVCTVCGYEKSETGQGNLEDIQEAELSIHFMELGNANAGDSTLIKCGDTEVLIDAGSKRNSTRTVKDYIDTYCTDGKLEYVIATHAHEDHIAALAGEEGKNNGVLYSYEIGTIITFAGHKTNSVVYRDFETAVTYAESRGAVRYTAKECWYEENGAEKQYYLDGDNQKISLNVLYQKYYDQTTSNENNYSVCTLLSQYINANTTYNYLFTGDLEKAGEESLAESNNLPQCKLFKGGHHGSSTSSNDVLLSKIRPENIAICTCAGTYEYADKPTAERPESVAKLNTFPTQEAIDRMSKYTQNIYVTTLGILNEEYATVRAESMNGNIVFYYKDGKLNLYCSNNDVILKDTDWFKENRTWTGV